MGFTLYFLDVESAEAMVLKSHATGETMLLEGGEFASLLSQRLGAAGIMRVDALLPTHWHENHTRAQLWALDAFDIKHFWWNGDTGNNLTFQRVVDKAKQEAKVTVLQRGDSFTFGGLDFQVMHPASMTGDANTDSLAIVLSCGSIKVWLGGDATGLSEVDMLAAGAIPQVSVLKLGHHGGEDATSQAFLDALKPQAAVYSWGRTSSSIPGKGVMDRLKAAGVTVYGTDVTDRNDSLKLTSDCSSFSIERVQ
jgi:competence protein ComEC